MKMLNLWYLMISLLQSCYIFSPVQLLLNLSICQMVTWIYSTLKYPPLCTTAYALWVIDRTKFHLWALFLCVCFTLMGDCHICEIVKLLGHTSLCHHSFTPLCLPLHHLLVLSFIYFLLSLCFCLMFIFVCLLFAFGPLSIAVYPPSLSCGSLILTHR